MPPAARARVASVSADQRLGDLKHERIEALKASPPIFETPTLDRLTRVHPAIPAMIFLPTIFVLAGIAFDDQAHRKVIVELICGYAFWTLCEYWGHRAVFHFEPADGVGARLHWMIHGVHHDHPNDPKRLVLPPAFSLPLAAGFLGLFYAVLGTPDAWGACAGFFAGYLLYDMVHFALHHTHPHNPVGKRLRELHMRHHFEDHERGFGVSAPWWDLVFGTYSKRARRSG
jgi:sterol desaturase/sphingolipid hydroxylase (fatty acid hydroxylase superfamily)